MHFQSELGDVVYVELPEIGKEVKAGATFGVVESVKVRPSIQDFRRSMLSVVRLTYQCGISHNASWLVLPYKDQSVI